MTAGPPLGGCPACGSDDYICEPVPGGDEPDYEGGVKQCQGCGKEWT